MVFAWCKTAKPTRIQQISSHGDSTNKYICIRKYDSFNVIKNIILNKLYDKGNEMCVIECFSMNDTVDRWITVVNSTFYVFRGDF